MSPVSAFYFGLLIPLCGVFILIAYLKWDVWRREERSPFPQKLLRSPGESLQGKIDKLSEQVGELAFLAVMTPVMLCVCLFFIGTHQASAVHMAIVFLLSAISFAVFSMFLMRIGRRLRAYRLGFLGERAAGEEINRLMLDQCHVFHDLPMDPYGNIDHVIVAPTGVYAVETKTRRKCKAPPGRKDHEVIFDGLALDFPHWRDSHCVDQAKQQADRLHAMLTKAVGEDVKVTPVLTIPGWLIREQARGALRVLAPKGIRSYVMEGNEPGLSRQLMDRIAWQLDQRCRDVEL